MVQGKKNTGPIFHGPALARASELAGFGVGLFPEPVVD